MRRSQQGIPYRKPCLNSKPGYLETIVTTELNGVNSDGLLHHLQKPYLKQDIASSVLLYLVHSNRSLRVLYLERWIVLRLEHFLLKQYPFQNVTMLP